MQYQVYKTISKDMVFIIKIYTKILGFGMKKLLYLDTKMKQEIGILKLSLL